MGWLRKHWQKLTFVGFVVTILILLAFLIVWPHLWKKYTHVEVIRNGQAASGASLYYSRDGVLFIDMGTSDEWYYFSNEKPHLGLCSSPRRITLLGYIYMINDGQNMPCVVYSEVKTTDPHLITQQGFIEFDSRKGGRIRIRWNPTL